jgi:hypothetical protein
VLRNVKNSIPSGRICSLKLHVVPNNGDRHFFRTLQCEETKGIIHSRIPERAVTSRCRYRLLSALISCNFIIKNYVNRKITSHIYLLIFTKSLWLHVKHFIALTKRESVRRIVFFFCNYQSGLPLSTHRPRKIRENTTALVTKKKKKTCVHMKRV